MKLELTNETKEIEINGEAITVYDRISTAHKEAIIITCLKEASQGSGVYNKILFEASFYCMIALAYTNLKDKIDDFKEDNMPLIELYDLLEANDIIKEVISTVEDMNKGEVSNFIAYATDMYQEAKETADSAGFAISNLVSVASTTFGDISSLLSLIEKQKEDELKEKEEDKISLKN